MMHYVTTIDELDPGCNMTLKMPLTRVELEIESFIESNHRKVIAKEIHCQTIVTKGQSINMETCLVPVLMILLKVQLCSKPREKKKKKSE